MPSAPLLRPPAVAGRFYPSCPEELRLQVEDMLARAPDLEIESDPIGLLAPHAGYPYSGQVAAAAYRPLRGLNYDTVVIMAPSHRESCKGASVFPGEAYETPLGVVPVDKRMAQRIEDPENHIYRSFTGHGVADSSGLAGEHAVEVHLPFLQVVLPGLRILPIVMEGESLKTCEALAESLVREIGPRKILLVASSDLYHGNDYSACHESDESTLKEIERFDPAHFASSLEDGRMHACGGGAILTMMIAARMMGADQLRILDHTNSTDVSGQPGDYVVGYGAAILSRPTRSDTPTDAFRDLLFRIARDAVHKTARGVPPEDPQALPEPISPRGAFVTISREGALRGCIGDIEGRGSVCETVQRMAVAAATRDPRFPAIDSEELDTLEIEISLLRPFQPMSSPEEIEVGVHGVLVRRDNRQGLLLPRVAVDQGWSRDELLRRACLKAQLPAEAWKDPETSIYLFRADSFSG